MCSGTFAGMANLSHPSRLRLTRIGSSDGFEPLFYHTPIEVLEECVYVFALARRAVVEEKRVFPHIERQNDGQSDEMSLVLLAGKSREELISLFVVIQNRPAGPAHVADLRHDLDDVFRFVCLLQRFSERAVRRKLFRPAFELLEVVLVQSHAVEFARTAAEEL